jgi:DNA-directed RNA polymerase subunit RPC12/RpoP
MGWIIGPMMTLATVAGAILVLRGPERAFGAALGALLGTALTWTLISVLWPATPDRTCPECGEKRLVRLDPRTTRGIACGSCGHEDVDHSAFLLAEDDDGPIEPIVLDERTGGRRPAS